MRGGEVIDPSQGIRERRDIALSGSKVALVAEDIPTEEAKEIRDVSGKVIAPGLIDIHGHFFAGFVPGGVDPDQVCLPKAVTTAVDAGSSGCFNFAAFRDFIVSRSKTRLYD